MKIFLDTNILISAFISKGTTFTVVKHCIEKGYSLFVSKYVLKELNKVLSQKLKFKKSEIDEITTVVKLAAKIAPAGSLKKRVSRDKKDDPILSAAIKIEADCILTGDKDLLLLEKYEAITIINPTDFWKFESTK